MVLGDHDVSQEGETEAVSYAAKEVRVHPGQKKLAHHVQNVLSLAVPVACHMKHHAWAVHQIIRGVEGIYLE